MAIHKTLILGVLLIKAAALSTPEYFPRPPRWFAPRTAPAFGRNPAVPQNTGLPHPAVPQNTELPQPAVLQNAELPPSEHRDMPHKFREIGAPPAKFPHRKETPPSKKSYMCTDDEGIVLRPVEQLVNRIKGKIGSNYTLKPFEKPALCNYTGEGGKTEDTVAQCYVAWGFTRPLANCYAKEEMSQVCIMNYCKDPDTCNTCYADLRNERRKCIFTQMGIEEPCQTCAIQAYDHWDQKCLAFCANAFEAMEIGANITECRSCNDHFTTMLKDCGI